MAANGSWRNVELSERHAEKESYGPRGCAMRRGVASRAGPGRIHNNLGICLQRLGDLRAGLSEHQAAKV